MQRLLQPPVKRTPYPKPHPKMKGVEYYRYVVQRLKGKLEQQQLDL